MAIMDRLQGITSTAIPMGGGITLLIDGDGVPVVATAMRELSEFDLEENR
jgi:hypothetical protein